jgi:hypothetical protein
MVGPSGPVVVFLSALALLRAATLELFSSEVEQPLQVVVGMFM